MADLSPNEGILGFDKAKHLLDRVTFGAKLDSIRMFSQLTVQEAINILLTDKNLPYPPLCIDPDDPDVTYGTTWINAPFNNQFTGTRLKSLRSWWLSLYLKQEDSLIGKMHLFWHNHFVTEVNVVRRPRYLYKYVKLLYESALGNFGQLVKDITINPAMLKYLDGIENVAGSPNENYARELFELFSIGKGPLIAEGNYTNYTEDDIQEASRALTGWRVNTNTAESFFNSALHDKGEKVFSNIYDNRKITNLEENEYAALIDMILDQQDTALHIVRKLYRWFVYYEIDDEIENDIIQPLAAVFYESNYDIKALLSSLLSSDHFFSETIRGAYIKNPLEHTIGTLRKVEVEFPEDIFAAYELWNVIYWQTNNQELKLGYPPDVAGWPQWYLAPQFNRLWINSVTIPQKAIFTDKMLNSGFTRLNKKIEIDPLRLVERFITPSDPNELIREIAAFIYPFPLTYDKIDDLKEILIPGLPDFEWTVEWNKYKNDPSDTQQKQAVSSALAGLLKEMFRRADYNLT